MTHVTGVPGYVPAVPWLKHQIEELRQHWSDPCRAWFWEMGTGKTAAALGLLGILVANDDVDGMVVICPKPVRRVWVNAIKEHVPQQFRDKLEIQVWRSGRKLNAWGQLRHRVLIVNVEALSTGTGAYTAVRELLEQKRCLLVVDESTSIKSRSSTRAKVVAGYKDKKRHYPGLAPLAKYRRILTGSPVTKSPLDLFMQFKSLDWEILGHRSFWTFQAEFAVTEPLYLASRTIQQVVGYRNLSALAERIRPYTSRVLKKDCLDLPPKIYRSRDVELTDEQRRIYEDLREVAVAELSDGRYISSPAVISQILRCHQVICGWVGTEDGAVVPVKSNRLSVLLEVLDETQDKVIIWCSYQANVVEITDAINDRADRAVRAGEPDPGRAVSYYGATSDQDRDAAVDGFADPDGPRYFVATPHTAGMGLDRLQTSCSTVVYYSNTYDLMLREQSEDRSHRMGQSRSVTYVDLVSPGTLDETILRALREKIDLAAAVMRDGPREWII